MKRNLQLTLTAIIIVLSAAFLANAQVASNPPYTLEQSVIAGGGGQGSTGGAFSLDGTIGQPIAGTRSTNSPFDLTGGFWTAPQSAPTAAGVTVGGRVTTSDGRGIRNVRVTLTGMDGESRTALTGTFGYYRFADVPAGETYIFSVFAKRFTFAQNTQVRSIMEDTDDINFVADIL